MLRLNTGEIVKKFKLENSEVAVYGFGDCLYELVHDSLRYTYPQSCKTYNFNEIPYWHYKGNNMMRGGIVNIILENMNRIKHGEALVKFIFVAGREYDGKQLTLNPNSVANYRFKNYFTCSSRELRQIYKIYYECNNQIKYVMAATFVFCKTVQDKEDKELYHVEQIPPYWQDGEWANMWSSYLEDKKSRAAQPKKEERTRVKGLWRSHFVMYKQNIGSTLVEVDKTLECRNLK